MKEILIISYFYPPCTLTAAQRPAGWVKHLHHFGYKPILVTRIWESEIKKPEDQLFSTESEIKIEKSENFEVHYLPYIASLRDKLFTSENKILKFSSKILTLFNSIGENYSNFFISYSNIYHYSEKIIEDRSIKALIVTANPYNQFRFGYLINKKFNIPWIADYRDDWTTSEINTSITFNSFLLFFNKRSEKKWVGTSSLITSVSKYYTEKIESFVGIPGVELLNGFDEDNYKGLNQTDSMKNDALNIVYNGSLYDSQPIEGFIAVIRELNYKYNNYINIYFPGLAFNKSQANRLANLIKGFENHVFITERISKDKVLNLQNQCDLLLMISHTGYKGIPSSKLYEYIGFKKPILLFPSDKDIIQNTLDKTGLGVICNNTDILKSKIEELIIHKKSNTNLKVRPNLDQINLYSNYYQTSILATILNSVIK
jgi:hypothetical protein